jgi:hypothetical protein
VRIQAILAMSILRVGADIGSHRNQTSAGITGATFHELRHELTLLISAALCNLRNRPPPPARSV